MSEFRPLKDLVVSISDHGPKPLNKVDLSLIDVINTEPFEMMVDIESVSLDNLQETISQLRALKAAIERFGVTRSLIAFADYNKILSSAIPAVPSLESLAGDLSVKRSGDVIVALEASISDAIEIFIRKLKARAKNMIARLKDKGEKIHAHDLHIKTLKKMISEGRELDEKQAKTRAFRLLDKARLHHAFDLVLKIDAFSKSLSNEPLPDSETTYKEWLSKNREIINNFAKDLGWSLDEYGRFVDSEPNFPLTTATLVDHGYTSLSDFDTISNEFDKIEKISDNYAAYFSKVISLLDHSRNDPTMAYLHKSSVIVYNVLWAYGIWSMWVLDNAAFNVLKAIFACSEKSKK